MNVTSEQTSTLRSALEHPAHGIVGMVDVLLKACRLRALQLDWQANHCRTYSTGKNPEELLAIPLRKSVFRAILARLAALCNEWIPNSVSPRGGNGELSAGGEPPTLVSVAFVNTPAEQKLELRPENELLLANTHSGPPAPATSPEPTAEERP